MAYVGAVDQGTTSSRFIIFDEHGRIVAMDQKEHEQIYPKPGWVEHDPMEIWNNTQDVIRGPGQIRHQGLRASSIGITNQRETTVVWDRFTANPTNAIVWQCTAPTKSASNSWPNGGQDRFRLSPACPWRPIFRSQDALDSGQRARSPRRRREGQRPFGTIETWIIWWLTGGPKGGAHVTDVTNASRTMLMDLKTLAWDEEILKIMGIPVQGLPRIVPSSDSATWGPTSEDGPLGARVPVCGAVGDQQAALVGQTCFAPGEAKNTMARAVSCSCTRVTSPSSQSTG
jgi:glycerol kinase (EC 2.7.1.30)